MVKVAAGKARRCAQNARDMDISVVTSLYRTEREMIIGGLFAIGILGVYLSKVFIEVKQRPYTIVREIHDRTAELAPRP